MDIEQLATSKIVELISRTNRLVADINALDKKPIWDGYVYLYDKPADKHKKRDYRASIPVQVKGTKQALTRDGDGVHYVMETDDLNAYLTNRPTVFFVVTMDEQGAHRTVYYRVFRQEDVEDILSTLKAGQETKTLSFSPLPTEPDELEALFLPLADVTYIRRPAPAAAVSVTDPYLYNAGTVTFRGRADELRRLDAFLGAPEPFRWWGVAAAGGAGKTRLAYEWGRRDDWAVHWLRSRDYDALEQWSDPDAPTLLIADYAWQHADALGKWMDTLCEDAPSQKVRVLLLERDAGEEYGEFPWEKQLYQAGNEAHLRRARHEKMLRLPALDDGALQELMRDFAASLQKRGPELPTLPDGEEAKLLARLRIIDPDCRPLFAMLLTDASLRGKGSPDSRETLLEDMVTREKAQRLGAVKALTKDEATRKRLERLGGELRLLATALGADGNPSVSQLAALLPDAWAELGECAKALGLSSQEALLLELGLLRVAGGVLRVPALRPDLLGEYALLRALRDCPAVELPRRDALYAAALGEGEVLERFVLRFLNDYSALLNRKPELWARLFPNMAKLDLSHAASYSHLLYGAFYRCTNREQRLALLANMEQCAAGIREDTADAGTVYNNLGLLYHHLGIYDKALEYHQRALAIRAKALGAEHPETATSYNNLGEVYRAMVDLDKALEYHQRALAIREKVLGAEHPDAAYSYNNLGLVYRDMGELSKALKYLQRALAIDEKILGAEHPETAIDYGNLGNVYCTMGDLPRGAENCQRALAIHEKVLGAEHPFTATGCNYLGTVYRAMGELDKALEYHQSALAIREKVLGANHPSTAMSCFNVSTNYYELHNLPEALRYAERTLTIWQNVHGAEHPDTKLAQEWVDILKNM